MPRVKAFLKVRFSRVSFVFCGGGLRPVLKAASSLNGLLEVKRRGDREIGSTGARLGRKRAGRPTYCVSVLPSWVKAVFSMGSKLF